MYWRLSIILCLVIIKLNRADIIHVPADEPNLYYAVNEASEGDTVLVAPGTYSQHMVLWDKRIVIASHFILDQDSSFITNTILDGENYIHMLGIEGIGCDSAVISGFTFTNCFHNRYGAAISIFDCSPILSNLVIKNSWSGEYGGGISCWNGNPVLKQVQLIQNYAGNGGGGLAALQNSNPYLTECMIKDNEAELYGGGIYCDASALEFDTENRSSIYLNYAGPVGNDIYYDDAVEGSVTLDTFSVAVPADYHIYPVADISFDTRAAKINQSNSDLYVALYGSDENDGSSLGSPLKTIKVALLKCVSDEAHPNMIYIDDGIYSKTTNGERFPVYLRNYISLTGNNKQCTILDAEENNCVIKAISVDSVLLKNLTITGGSQNQGGGIYCDDSNVNFEEIIIKNNQAYTWYSSGTGGGLFSHNSNLLLRNIYFSDNASTGSGGALCSEENSILKLENVQFSNSYCEENGGAIYSMNSILNINNSNFNNNKSNLGGAIYLNQVNGLIDSVDIRHNEAQRGGGIFLYNNPDLQISQSVISENIAIDKGGGIYYSWSSDIQFDTEKRSNIFLNRAKTVGNDLYIQNCPTISVVLDTFTIVPPTEVFAYPLNNFTFDILNAKIERISDDLYVSPGGNNNNDGLSFDSPLKSIDFALLKVIADSSNPRTIYLDKGIYSPSKTGEYFPLYLPSYLSIKGVSGKEAVLDGEGVSRILMIENSKNNELMNLTITHGTADAGAGIYCVGSNPSLKNVSISENSIPETSNGSGAGMYFEDSESILDSVNIHSNIGGSEGAGIYIYYNSEIQIKNTKIWANQLRYTGRGAGVCCISSLLNMQNVMLEKNEVSYYGQGAGLYSNNSTVSLNSVILRLNIMDDWGKGGGLFLENNSSCHLISSLICQNDAGHFGMGGGIYYEASTVSFDSIHKCSIYSNNAETIGNDIYLGESQHLCAIVDTFTVLFPKTYHVYPKDSVVLTIDNAKILMVEGDLYVSPDGDNDNNGLSQDQPMKSIAYALSIYHSLSDTTSVIYLAEGEYSYAANREKFPIMLEDHVHILGKSMENVILNANEENRILMLNDLQNVIIENLTITGGRTDWDEHGGGIYCRYSNPVLRNIIIDNNSTIYRGDGGGFYCFASNPHFINVTIKNNYADANGGGLYCSFDSSPIFKNVQISSNNASGAGGGLYINSNELHLSNVDIKYNRAYSGGGLAVVSSSPRIDSIVIRGNYAPYGGGIYCGYNASPNICHVVLINNSSSAGGGVYCRRSNPKIVHSTIINNTAADDYWAKGGAVHCNDNSHPVIVNSILWDNTNPAIQFNNENERNTITMAYSDLFAGVDNINVNNNGEVLWLEGNINSNPLFADSTDNPYYLSSASPCIDKATPLFVLNGDTLVNKDKTQYKDDAPDMGAFEGVKPIDLSVANLLLPKVFRLEQNYPNPFNPATTIAYQLPVATKVKLTIYNILGQKIRSLVNEVQPVGYYKIVWDGNNDCGVQVGSAVYFYRFQTDAYTKIRKMILVR